MSLLEQLAAKAQVTGDVGEGLDKDMETAQAEVHQLMGAARWIKEGAKGLLSLSDHMFKDFEAGKYNSLEGKAVHDLLLDYNRKAVECLLNFAELKKSEALVANGKVVGLRSALDAVKKHHVSAMARVAQIREAVASEEPPSDEDALRQARKERVPGEHPGSSPLDGRRIEALKQSNGKPVKKVRSRRATS